MFALSDLTLMDLPVQNQDEQKLPLISITNVTRWIYGQFDDGSYAIWALGHSGWFEIHPSREYQTRYHDDVEAVSVFYFLKDAHKWSSANHGVSKLFQMVSTIALPRPCKVNASSPRSSFRKSTPMKLAIQQAQWA
jgi:hypothetical protein